MDCPPAVIYTALDIMYWAVVWGIAASLFGFVFGGAMLLFVKIVGD